MFLILHDSNHERKKKQPGRKFQEFHVKYAYLFFIYLNLVSANLNIDNFRVIYEWKPLTYNVNVQIFRL